MIYYCEDCELFFTDEDIKEIKPDVGTFHSECMSQNINEIDEKQILVMLNESL